MYDAAARWGEGQEHQVIIDAATQALVDDLDSPALRTLAGLTADLRRDEIESVLADALDELGLPVPGQPGSPTRDRSSEVYDRLPTDVIRFAVSPASRDLTDGFELQVFVNEVEMTSRGAGMGMDPFDVIVPVNKLHAETTPRQVPIARCECGTYGCGSTDVLIRRDGDVVHWDWLLETPASSGASFVAEQYDAEVERLVADRSWERPADTATRLILQQVDHARLAEHRLQFSWAARHFREPDQFLVSLMADNTAFQVFLTFPFINRSPEEVAAAVVETLSSPPTKWRASYKPTMREHQERPSMSSRRWRVGGP
ncbi:hypothetical protein ABT304_27180 [Nocardioides sp. NPDC000445]|uniref:hypothetical protein n=1 Tax=Nocardioides sp. NPDC000445 TaxID=3154257 RepID=UPI00331BD561